MSLPCHFADDRGGELGRRAGEEQRISARAANSTGNKIIKLAKIRKKAQHVRSRADRHRRESPVFCIPLYTELYTI